MKKATLIIWVIIFGVMALVIFQNKAFFLSNQSLRVNLGVTEAYHTPELPIAILVLLFFLTGIAIAYLFSLSARLKARRTIKKLNTTIASQNDEVTGLKREIDSLKGIETPENEPAPESKNDADDTQKLAGGGHAGDQAATGAFSSGIKADDGADNPEEKTDEIK
jgi:uncharacterized integral membrane protein